MSRLMTLTSILLMASALFSLLCNPHTALTTHNHVSAIPRPAAGTACCMSMVRGAFIQRLTVESSVRQRELGQGSTVSRGPAFQPSSLPSLPCPPKPQQFDAKEFDCLLSTVLQIPWCQQVQVTERRCWLAHGRLRASSPSFQFSLPHRPSYHPK